MAYLNLEMNVQEVHQLSPKKEGNWLYITSELWMQQHSCKQSTLQKCLYPAISYAEVKIFVARWLRLQLSIPKSWLVQQKTNSLINLLFSFGWAEIGEERSLKRCGVLIRCYFLQVQPLKGSSNINLAAIGRLCDGTGLPCWGVVSALNNSYSLCKWHL